MQWIEVSVPTRSDEIDDVCAQLAELGAGGMVVEDETDFQQFLEQNHQYWDYVDDALEAQFRGVSRIKFYLADDDDGRAQLAAIRAGRANPAILDKVAVDYYGSPTPIQQIAAVAVAEARILTISPWDRSMLKPISKAIQTSDIGINPIDDGQVIRLVFPAPTEERRKQLTKDVKKQGEDAKTAVRNIRRDAMDKFKAMKKAGELTEDDQKKLEEETQKLTDKYVKLIDDTCADKNKEIMEV